MSAIARIEVLLDVDSLLTPEDIELQGYQLTQAKLADMAFDLGKAQLALHPGRLNDDGKIRPEQISVGKLNNVREAIVDRPIIPNPVGCQRNHRGVSGDSARHQPRVRVGPRRHVGGAPDGDR